MKLIKVNNSLVNADNILRVDTSRSKWTYYAPGEERHLSGQGTEITGVTVSLDMVGGGRYPVGSFGEVGSNFEEQEAKAVQLFDAIGAWLTDGKDGIATMRRVDELGKNSVVFTAEPKVAPKAEKKEK